MISTEYYRIMEVAQLIVQIGFYYLHDTHLRLHF